MLKLQSLCFYFLILICIATPFLFQGDTFPALLHACVLSHSRYVRLFGTLWTVALQAPLSMGFSRQEYWSGQPCPLPQDLPDSGIRNQRRSVGEKLARGRATADAGPQASRESPPHTPSATYHHLCSTEAAQPRLPVGDSTSHSFSLIVCPPSPQGESPSERTPPGSMTGTISMTDTR